MTAKIETVTAMGGGFMLSNALEVKFRDRGVVRVDGLIDPTDIETALVGLWDRLSRHGYSAGSHWRRSGELSGAPNAGAELVKGFDKSGPIKRLLTSRVTDVVRALSAGEAVRAMQAHDQLLFTLPNADIWRVPHQMWHLDLPRLADGGRPGVQAFACLNEIAPGAGGTLVVAGSHRLINGEFTRSRDLKKRLKREAWFRRLMSAGSEDRSELLGGVGYVGEVPVQVVELCGRPGDVYFVDLRTLHTLAPNAGDRPRIMLTQRFIRERYRDAVFGTSAGTEVLP